MILIADSGSTKTEWALIKEGKIKKKYFTEGINPYFQDAKHILHVLNKEFVEHVEPEAVYFYGAGCANREKIGIVEGVLRQFFHAEEISVNSDMLGAARGLCQDSKGIACILGTGSNSCFYNGRKITSNVSPLGYILGDEGSGAVLGRKFIGDLLKKQLPNQLKTLFLEEYELEEGEIINKVYRQPFPNRFLASFTPFIKEHIHLEKIETMVITSFKEFVQRNVLQYPEAGETAIHFTGSVALNFSDQLTVALQSYGLTTETIVQSPMQGLIKYHS